ncbi:MAG TPA: DHHA1 domain-containing protein [Terriglobia bacterium]|nr:DHHA1 domain-containing protein [Terriglobia bacterium]
MPKTERLYYTDCYRRDFEARVIHIEPEARGVRVTLDRSAFYPESGGQPRDYGTLDGVPVLDVIAQEDAIAVVLARKPAVEVVRGSIDWARRFDHMQQHTGQHVLSAAFERAARSKTVSFHLGAEASSIDLDTDRLTRRQIDEAEELANHVVFEDREVRILFRSADEASRMDLRKPAERAGEVRLIEVADFDLSACGGTHVRRTGEIGLISARKHERIRAQTRVEFVCGRRALLAARRDFLGLSEAGRLLSGGLEQVPELVTKQADELRAAQRAREKLVTRLAEYRARELAAAAPEKNGRRIIHHVFAADELVEAKMIAHAVQRLPATIGLLAVGPAEEPSGSAGRATTLFFAQSTGGSTDMGALLKRTVAEFQGKGGGTCDFAQGGGIEAEKLEAALTWAEKQLEPA